MDEPLVSIVIPVYNSERYLRQTLNSLLAQTYKNIEIIAVNDGSTDKSSDILKSFSGTIKFFTQENQGQGIARNMGCKRASGALLSFIDSDDLWDVNKLEKQVALLGGFPEAVATYCDYRTIDEDGVTTQRTSAVGTPRPSGNILQQALFGNCLGSPSVVLMRKDAFDSSGGFNETQSRAAEDYGLWLSLATLGPIIYSPDTLVSYRRHASQTTQGPIFFYNRAVGTLNSLDRIASHICQIKNKDTHDLYHARVWKSLLTLAWAARVNRVHQTEFYSYFRAWRMRPWRLDIALRILLSLRPN